MIAQLRSLALARTFLAAALVCAPALAHSDAQQTPPGAAPAASKPAARDIDLKAELDRVVAWLRSTQDLQSGSYAGGVPGTSWVLAVLADSPRKYRRPDGPFVQKALEFLAKHQAADGSIHDADAKGPQIAEQNALAVMALSRHADAESKALLAKALAFAGQSTAAPAATGIALPADKDALKKLGNELVAKKTADGTWEGPQGKVIETARVALALCEIYTKTSASSSSAAPAAIKPLPKLEEADRAKAQAALLTGAQFLVMKAKDGKYEARPGEPDAGLTAMAIGALACVPEPRPADVQKTLDQGITWLASLAKPDGAIHDGQLANYTTSAVIGALVRAGKTEHKAIVQRARDWLVTGQFDEAEGYSPDHPFYGGNGYGDEQRPDLSNVQFALEALSAAGLEKENPAYARALKFLQRCQNRSESNDIKVVDADGKTIVSGDDGGSGYAPGVSKAGFIELSDGRKVARSYGSMSYALLKCLILCGVPKEDPRMQACWEWLRKHYTLDVNPGFEASSDPAAPYQGYFYYLNTMAKTLALHGDEMVVDAQGKENPWRKQICGRLVAMQRKADGAWTNENSTRWWEGNPVLATTYAVYALDAAMPK